MSRFLKWKNSRKSRGATIPSSREGHTLTYVQGVLLMFGGCSNQKNNELYIFDLADETWERKQTKGRYPDPRCYHRAVYNKRLHALVVVGGYTTQNISVNDVYFLLLEDWTWKEYRSMESFPKRHHFSLVEVGDDEMVLFGGVSRPAETLLADTWKVCLGGCRFSQDHAPKGLVIAQMQTSGRSPSRRYGHQSFLQNQSMYVFGGHSEQGQQDETIYMLNLQGSTWTCFIPSINAQLGSRAFSMVMRISPSEILVFGGTATNNTQQFEQTAILDVQSSIWSVPFVAGYRPENRCHFGSVQLDEPTMLIIGGIFDRYCSMEFLELELGVNTQPEWELITRPSNLQVKAVNLLSSTIVSNNQDILALEWAIREQAKTAHLLRVIQTNRIAKKERDELQRQQRLKILNDEKEQYNRRLEEFNRQQSMLCDLLQLEKERSANWQHGLQAQQTFLVWQLWRLQKLQSSCEPLKLEKIKSSLTDLNVKLRKLLEETP